MFFTKKQFITVTLIVFCFFLFPHFASATVNSTGYAWGENAGWANFNSTYGGATVAADGVTGYLWLENVGWIHLDYDDVAGATNTTSTNWGVTNDGSGNLGGYAWGENIGWINFHSTYSQVIITAGAFSGYAWSENIGWIKMDHAQTASRPATTWAGTTTFTSTQTGVFNIGTTWDKTSCASSCTAGVDFPNTADTAVIASGHTVTLDSARTVATLTVNSGGIFEPSTYLLTETTLGVTGTINVGAATFAGSYSATPTLNAGSTVNYNLAGTQTVLNTLSYINLTISGSGTKTLGGATTVSGNLTHTAGTLATSTYALNVAGNWAGNGNTVTGSGAGAVVLNGTLQTISGETTFYNLTKDVSATAAYTLTFTAGSVQTISHTLTLKGALGKVLTLVSGTPGTRWVLTAPSGATYVVDYVNVTDSDASRGNPINATNSTNSGNNLNWGFGVSAAPVPSGFNPADSATITSTPVITFVLNVIGDCRAATSDLGYDDMSPYVNCAGDGTTNGVCQMTDLGTNGSKTIYISCQDAFGNKDTAGTNHSVTYTLGSPSSKLLIIKGKIKTQGTIKIK